MAICTAASRRRTLWCAALMLLAIVVAAAFVTAQEQAAAPAADIPPVAGAASIKAEEAVAAAPAEKLMSAPGAEEEDAAAAQAAAAAAAEAEAAAAEAKAAAEAEAAAAEAERQRKAAEEAERQRKAAEEAERQRKAAEEAERQRKAAEEAERQRKAAEEAERKRKAAEEAERQRKAAEEEKRKRTMDTVDTIRYTAEELPQGCVRAVEQYLFRVHEQWQMTAAAVQDVRSALNEARVHAPETVAAREKALAAAQDALLVYDIETLRRYGGNVPKTCIAESHAWLQQQPSVTSDSDYVQAYTHFYRLVGAHLRTVYMTGLGLGQYIINSYKPVAASFMQVAVSNYGKAAAIYAKLMPASGARPVMPVGDLLQQLATMVGYGAVPVGLGIAGAVVALIVMPPVVAGVIAYELVYKIWVELFFGYYVYGVRMPEGAIASAKAIFATVQAGEWGALGSRFAEGFFDLVVDADSVFYNGIIAMFLVSHIVVFAAVLMCCWCRFCVPGMGSRKARKSPLQTAKTSSSGGKKPADAKAAGGNKKKSTSSPTPAPGAAAAKKN